MPRRPSWPARRGPPRPRRNRRAAWWTAWARSAASKRGGGMAGQPLARPRERVRLAGPGAALACCTGSVGKPCGVQSADRRGDTPWAAKCCNWCAGGGGVGNINDIHHAARILAYPSCASAAASYAHSRGLFGEATSLSARDAASRLFGASLGARTLHAQRQISRSSPVSLSKAHLGREPESAQDRA